MLSLVVVAWCKALYEIGGSCQKYRECEAIPSSLHWKILTGLLKPAEYHVLIVEIVIICEILERLQQVIQPSTIAQRNKYKKGLITYRQTTETFSNFLKNSREGMILPKTTLNT